MRNHLKLGTSGLFVAGGGEAGHFPGRAGLTQDENMKMMKATVPTEAVGRIIDAGQEAIMEILA